MDSSLSTPRFALALLVLLAAVGLVIVGPTLSGKAVYLDEAIRDNATLNDLGDVREAFTRTSMDYQRGASVPAAVDPSAVTYRPVTMATVAATQATARSIRAHHLVSWALHVVAALVVALAVRRAKRPDWVAVLAALVVIAHPVAVEAWVWISGRADLLGGLCLALLALVVPADLRGKPWARIALGSVVVLVGSLSKETFMILAPAVMLRGAFGKDVSWGVRGALVASFAVPLVIAWTIRTSLVDATTAVPLEASDVQAWLLRAPRLIAEAGGSLVLPWHRPMRSLSLELLTRIGPIGVIGALALGLGLASAVMERRAGLLLVLLASIACVIPTAHVADTFWLGFDRFLYMPLVAIAIVAAESWEGTTESSPMLRAVVGLGVGLLVAVSNLQATDLRSTRTLATAITTERANDPSGSLLRAAAQIQAGELIEGRRTLEMATSTHVPAFESRKATLYVQSHEFEPAVRIVDALVEARPTDPIAAKDAIAVGVARSRWAELPARARVAARRAVPRSIACLALGGYADRMKRAPWSQRGPFLRAQRILHCERGRGR